MRVKTLIGAAALGLTFSGSALAESENWVPLDQRVKDFRPYLAVGGGVANGIGSDDSVSMFTAGGGIKVGRFFALELNRANLGEFSEKTPEPAVSDVQAGAMTGDTFYNERALKLSGFGIGVVGYLPVSNSWRMISRFDAYRMKSSLSKNGVSFTEAQVSDTGEVIVPAKLTPTSENKTENVMYYGIGLGAETKIAPNTFVRGQGQYFGTDMFGGNKGESFYTINVQLMQRL